MANLKWTRTVQQRPDLTKARYSPLGPFHSISLELALALSRLARCAGLPQCFFCGTRGAEVARCAVCGKSFLLPSEEKKHKITNLSRTQNWRDFFHSGLIPSETLPTSQQTPSPDLRLSTSYQWIDLYQSGKNLIHISKLEVIRPM